MDLFAKVVLDQNLEKPLDYLVPAHLRDIIKPGHRVLVPLKEKPKKGTILSIEIFRVFQM